MQRYIVIGNGVAAVGCIEGIRSVDNVTPITVVSAEKHPVYCRPLISYYLEDKTDRDKMHYRPVGFYEKMGCEVLYGVSAVKIDAQTKTVVLDNGNTLSYSAVCVATGSSPFVPPVPGLDSVPQKCTFMTLDDALELEKVVTPSSRVLIVGAGLIGLKCAEGLAARAGNITVCDLADRVLSSILDHYCATLVQKHIEDHGIRFMLSDSVERFDGNTAYMRSGATVDFDVLVLAVGVRANSTLAKDAGAAVNRGILVNERMETSISDVYAAGDCAEGEDISCGEKRVLAIMPNAYLQGRCAGMNMAGGNETFNKGIPMNSIGFFGLHVMTAGSYYGADNGGEVYEEEAAGKYKRLYSRDGYLTGFIIIGNTERAGIYTSLIRERIPLSAINYEMLKKVVSLAPFSDDYRKQRLEGVV
jgi:NAD(P)H-nitrite reductase large subunit